MTTSELRDLKIKILAETDLNKRLDYFPKMNAYEFMFECNKNRMDSFALNYLGRKYTFNELKEKIDIAARGYAELGIKPGDHVGMSMLATPEGIISVFALLKIGAKIHHINAADKPEQVAKQLTENQITAFIGLDILYNNKMMEVMNNAQISRVFVSSLTESLPNVLNTDKVKFELINIVKKYGNAVNRDPRCIKWDTLCTVGKYSRLDIKPHYIPGEEVMYANTSGSSGEPKTVPATHEAINAMPVQIGMTDETFAPGDSIFSTLPLWIYYSLVNNIHVPLCLGVCVDLDPIFDAKNIAKRVQQYLFEHWNTIPAYAEAMAKDKKIRKIRLRHMKSVTTGGDFNKISTQDAIRELAASNNPTESNNEIQSGQGYGASEILGSAGYTYEKDATPGSVGKMLTGNEFKIISIDNGAVLGPNQVGELYLFTPTIMKGYLNNPEATAEALVRDENGVVWYKTGDLAHYNERRELFIDGRIRRIEMVKDDAGNPTKLFPEKIKKVLLKHYLVDGCEVITADDEKHIKKPIAYIVLKNNIPMTPRIENELRMMCEAELPSYSVPTEYIFIDKIPLKPSLKPDIDELTRRYNERNSYRI